MKDKTALLKLDFYLIVFMLVWVFGFKMSHISVIGIVLLVVLVYLRSRCTIKSVNTVFGLMTGGFIFCTSLQAVLASGVEQVIVNAIDCVFGLALVLFYLFYGFSIYRQGKAVDDQLAEEKLNFAKSKKPQTKKKMDFTGKMSLASTLIMLLVGAVVLLGDERQFTFLSYQSMFLLVIYIILAVFLNSYIASAVFGMMTGIAVLIPVLGHIADIQVLWLPALVDGILGIGICSYSVYQIIRLRSQKINNEQ